MEHRGYTLQEAVNFVADLCVRCIQRFEAAREQLPSWGPEMDEAIRKYVLGLEHWISGSLFWSFETERYLGERAEEVLRTRVVKLSPKRQRSNVDAPDLSMPNGGANIEVI